MEQIRKAIRQMIQASEEELDTFLAGCSLKSYKRSEFLSTPGSVPNEIFFINKGLLRVLVTDMDGVEHTIHFGMENQFIADYSNFLRSTAAIYYLQALEPLEVVAISRDAIEKGYREMQQGERLGRLIAEYYFIYQDSRIMNRYLRSPREMYEHITEIFPDIHNRVPQHMIASYLGITPVHLSRLKKV